MAAKWEFCVLWAAALVLAGCGEQPTTTAASSTPPHTAAAAPPQLDAQTCVDVASANLDLLTSDSAEKAQAVKDELAKYDPPSDVIEALDHFVETGGVHTSDSDFAEYTDRVSDWVNEVCP